MEAARMYGGPIKKALEQAFPGRIKYRILEDNDPTGFKSTAGKAAKLKAKIEVFTIPKRSPQLNVCDYFLWSEVNKRMRATDRSWSEDRLETRDSSLRRLKRTAKSLEPDLIERSMGDMKRRCQLLLEAEGGQIEG